MSHTPGPWRAYHKDGYVYADAGDDSLSREHLRVGYAGRVVAESIQTESDLALIAAAPDLLAACEAMLAIDDVTLSEDEAHEKFTSACRTVVRAAVERAKQ